MRHSLEPNERTRFILRHGVIPWGIVAGGLAAVGGAFGLRYETRSTMPASFAAIVLIAALCFVTWCFVAGWVVGAVRWELRQMGNKNGVARRKRRRR